MGNILALLAAKLPALIKLSMVGFALFTFASFAELPVHDIWFDYVLFMIASSLVTGMPEPNVDLPLGRFLYTWFYQSGHLLVASATAYFAHQQRWQTVSDAEPPRTLAPASSVKVEVKQ